MGHEYFFHREERSAWLARVGAPARPFSRASPVCESHSPSSLLDGRPLQSAHALPSPLFSLLPTFDGRPLQSDHALPSSPFSLLSMKEDIRVHSWFSLQWTRGASAARVRSSAPSTHSPLPSPLSSLLPTFDGSPLQSDHALLSPLFSLFPTPYHSTLISGSSFWRRSSSPICQWHRLYASLVPVV